jgi:hypothetical protein
MSTRPLALACLVIALAACKPSTPADTAAPAPAGPAGTLEQAASALNPLSSPEDEMKASMDRFLKAKSFHAVMDMQGARSMAIEMDFVAPDRYRMKMPTGTQVVIGDTMYMQVDGRSMKAPLPPGTLTQWRDPLRIEEHKAGMSVESLGNDSVDGQPAKKYLVRHTEPGPSQPPSSPPQSSEFTFWIGGDGLPLQLVSQGEAQGKPYSMTLRYSRFDDPNIVIDAPQ